MTFERSKATQRGYKEWMKHTSVALDKLGLPPRFRGWTDRPEYRGIGIPKPNPRIEALLNIGWGKRMTTNPNMPHDELMQGWFADVSQSVERNPFGKLGTLATSSMKYSFEADCVLTAADHLALLGFPHGLVRRARETMTEAELRSLTGEAFAIPCVTLCTYLFYLNPLAPWWKAGVEVTTPSL